MRPATPRYEEKTVSTADNSNIARHERKAGHEHDVIHMRARTVALHLPSLELPPRKQEGITAPMDQYRVFQCNEHYPMQ